MDHLSSISKSTVIGIASLAGALFVGYCVYFDHKRRSAPDFKQKLRQKRKKQQEKNNAAKRSEGAEIPKTEDPAELQAFFLNQVQLGEELLSEGDYEGAVEHLKTAIIMCSQPQQLLQILNQTLPPQVFAMLMAKLQAEPGVKKSREGPGAESGADTSTGSVRVVEDTELE